MSETTLVLLDGDVVHPSDQAAVSNDGETVAYDIETELRIRDILLIQRDDETDQGWFEAANLSEGSPYDWNTFPVFSPDDSRVVFMCAAEPYGGYDTSICEYDLDEDSFSVVLTPEDHNAQMGTDSSAVHFPFYDQEGLIMYSDDNTNNTWKIDYDGDEMVITEVLDHAAVCIFPNDLMVVPLWDDEDMPIAFVNRNEKDEVFRVQTGLSGNQIFGFNCGGGLPVISVLLGFTIPSSTD